MPKRLTLALLVTWIVYAIIVIVATIVAPSPLVGDIGFIGAMIALIVTMIICKKNKR